MFNSGKFLALKSCNKNTRQFYLHIKHRLQTIFFNHVHKWGNALQPPTGRLILDVRQRKFPKRNDTKQKEQAHLDMTLPKWQSTCGSMLETVATHLLGPWPLTYSQQTISALPVMLIPAASQAYLIYLSSRRN